MVLQPYQIANLYTAVRYPIKAEIERDRQRVSERDRKRKRGFTIAAIINE